MLNIIISIIMSLFITLYLGFYSVYRDGKNEELVGINIPISQTIYCEGVYTCIVPTMYVTYSDCENKIITYKILKNDEIIKEEKTNLSEFKNNSWSHQWISLYNVDPGEYTLEISGYNMDNDNCVHVLVSNLPQKNVYRNFQIFNETFNDKTLCMQLFDISLLCMVKSFFLFLVLIYILTPVSKF